MDDKVCPSVTLKGTFQHYFVVGKKPCCNVHFIMLCSNALSLLSLNDFLVFSFVKKGYRLQDALSGLDIRLETENI